MRASDNVTHYFAIIEDICGFSSTNIAWDNIWMSTSLRVLLLNGSRFPIPS